MIVYILRRILLLPITLFAIILINFLIINLAPGDPTTYLEAGSLGEGRSSENQISGLGQDPQRLFRMRYGLNLPVIFNIWIFEKKQEILQEIFKLHQLQQMPLPSPSDQAEAARLTQKLGDKATFQMQQLLAIASDSSIDFHVRQLASQLMAKGAMRLGVGSLSLSSSERQLNQEIANENLRVGQWILSGDENDDHKLQSWNNLLLHRPDLRRFCKMSYIEKITQGLIHTRFIQYLTQIMQLNFGTLRSDSNRLVTQEVFSRIPISLFISAFPLILSFLISLPIGLIMALFYRRPLDHILNIILLCFYAAPVFVIAPMLIEFFAGNASLPWSHEVLPTSGFHSPKRDYDLMTSWQKLGDILHHVFLPMIAVSYSTLAAKARLARSSILEVLHQDYILCARARGVPLMRILFKHVLKNASITLVTAMAGSLGIILGGSLIVETLFDIDGFGKFFYESIVKRDINVVMFSTLVGSLLTLISYLIADITYTLLDPRVQLD